MAHFDDLHPCTYFGGDATHLLAVGWLEQGRPFPRGKCPSEFIARLEELLESPWAPVAFAGPHFCDLCPGGTAAGVGNLFVPDDAAVFAAPELISHYIEAHDYRPPDAFIAAVMRCPAMNSEEYSAAVARHYRFERQEGAGTRVPQRRESVRARPALFVGSTDSQGLEQMLFGLVENALEEHLAGRASRVAIHLSETGQVAIDDDGAGIALDGPGDLAKVDRITRLGMKGTMDRRVRINSESTGRRVAIVNALSSRFELESRRLGNSTRVVFERGELKEPLTNLGPTDAHGTRIEYQPDPEIFGVELLRVEQVADQLQELAWLCPKLDLRLQDRSLADPRGLEGLLEHLAGSDLVKDSVVRVDEVVDDVRVEVALGWKRSGVEADVRSFVNFRSSVSGSHVDAVFSALRPSSSLARARNTLRGLVAVVHVGIGWVHLEDGILDLPPVRRAVHTAIRNGLEHGAPWWKRHLAPH